MSNLSALAEAYLETLGLAPRAVAGRPPDRALLLEAAEQAAAEVEERWAAMRAAGELTAFSRGYKAARQAAQSAGRPFVDWYTYELEGKLNSARELARQHAAAG